MSTAFLSSRSCTATNLSEPGQSAAAAAPMGSASCPAGPGAGAAAGCAAAADMVSGLCVQQLGSRPDNSSKSSMIVSEGLNHATAAGSDLGEVPGPAILFGADGECLALSNLIKQNQEREIRSKQGLRGS